MTDIYGTPLDASTDVEKPATDALQAWMPFALARQEERLELPQGTLTFPVQWARVSDLIWRDDRLPAVIVESPGLLGDPVHDRGKYRATWQLDVVVITAGAEENDARDKASAYLAACKHALGGLSPTLDGHVSQCRWIGGDNHSAGRAPQNLPGQRAVYSTSFAVTVHNALDIRPPGRLTEPPGDPYNPPGLAPLPLEAVIEITTPPEED